MISIPAKRLAAALFAAALIGLGTAGHLSAREDATPPKDTVPPKVAAQHILTKPLAGEPDKEIDIQIYTFPPGSAVPWHIHQGAHEIAHVLEGTLMFEVEGKAPYPVKAGESNYLAPDVVHRGWNASKTEPATIYAVRIKPKDLPLTELIWPRTVGQDTDVPEAGDYPDP